MTHEVSRLDAGAVEGRSSTRITIVRFVTSLRGMIVTAGILFALMLALPGRTITSKYLNDLLIFLDGAHRIALGQVPNVDFHTSLGPLSFYIPALGYALSGSLSAAMPLGMALLTVLLAVVAGEIIGSRMRWVLGLPLALFLLLIVATPANPGEAISELSFAMFYNRIGWSALGLLFVLYLPRLPDAPRRDTRDAGAAALLILLMLLTKVTYGLIGFAFLLFMLTDRMQRRWVVQALGMVLGIGLLVELVWRGGSTYVADLGLASAVSGSLPPPGRFLDLLSRNLSDLIAFMILSAVLLVFQRSLRDFLFLGLCLTSGVLIIEQNFQIVGILTLGAGAAVVCERLMRAALSPKRRRIAALAPTLLTVLILPASAGNIANLGLHAGLALADNGEQVPLPRYEGIKLVRTFGPGAFNRFLRYGDTMVDGRVALEALSPLAQKVAVMDFANPFTAGLGLQPPKGDYPWYHWGRTIDGAHFPPAEEIFADADIVMQPKLPIERFTGRGMADLYAPYLTAHFRVVADTRDWIVYRRQQ